MYKMDKNLLINRINKFKTSNNNDVSISFVRKVNRKNEKYLFYTATLLDEIKEDIINTLFVYLSTENCTIFQSKTGPVEIKN